MGGEKGVWLVRNLPFTLLDDFGGLGGTWVGLGRFGGVCEDLGKCLEDLERPGRTREDV
jgi:hypothetical protein